MIFKSEGLIKVYYDRMTVKGVSLQVSEGEIVGLLGANGAGKTTTFYMMAGLIPPTEGEVFLGDKKITSLPLYERARLGIGYLPQEPSIFRQLSVEDNIKAVLEFTKLTKKERRIKLETLLDEFGLSHVRKNSGQVLSGGERRRTEIARALATNPTFLLLDEPFAGVDPIAVEEIQVILYRLKQKKLGILITDHNVDETLAITDHSYLMFEGSVLKQGTALELARDERVKKVYLGEHFELKKRIKKINPDNIESENENKDINKSKSKKTKSSKTLQTSNKNPNESKGFFSFLNIFKKSKPQPNGKSDNRNLQQKNENLIKYLSSLTKEINGVSKQNKTNKRKINKNIEPKPLEEVIKTEKKLIATKVEKNAENAKPASNKIAKKIEKTTPKKSEKKTKSSK